IDAGGLRTRAVIDGDGLPPAQAVEVDGVDVDVAAVGGIERDVDLDLVGGIGAGRFACAAVGTLQAADVRAGVLPDEALALIDGEGGVGDGDQVAAIPAGQCIAVGAVDPDPAALGRLAVGNRHRGLGRGDVGRRGIADAVAGDDAVVVGGRGRQPGVGEGVGRARPDLGPAGTAVRRTLDLV